jgi:hypothetical protein
VTTPEQFWVQLLAGQRRLLMCTLDDEERIQALVDSHGMGDLLRVQASAHVAGGTVLVFDEQYLDAARYQASSGTRTFYGGGSSGLRG